MAALRDRPARARLVAAAADLFQRHGVDAVGIEAILTDAATAKATLYKAFGSKEALVAAVVARQSAALRNGLRAQLTDPSLPAGAGVRRLVPVFEALAPPTPFGLALAHPTPSAVGADERIRAVAASHRDDLARLVADLANAAGAANPDATATQALLLLDGACVASAFGAREPAFHAAAAAFDTLLRAAAL